MRSGATRSGTLKGTAMSRFFSLILLVLLAVSASATTVATPSIDTGSGTFIGPLTVKITCATSSATIRYTLNGSNPTTTSAVYSGPLSITSSTTLNARAYKNGLTESALASATYTVITKVAAPVVTPGSGSYLGSAKLSISSSTSGAVVRGTVDGTTPT